MNPHSQAVAITNKIIALINEESKKPDFKPTEILLGLISGLKSYLKIVEGLAPKPKELIELERALDACALSLLTIVNDSGED